MSFTALYYTVLYCTVLYCTVLYCTVLYCTVLYCSVILYPIASFSMLLKFSLLIFFLPFTNLILLYYKHFPFSSSLFLFLPLIYYLFYTPLSFHPTLATSSNSYFLYYLYLSKCLSSLSFSFLLFQIQKAISESYCEYMAGRSYVYNTARNLDLASSGNGLDADGDQEFNLAE